MSDSGLHRGLTLPILYPTPHNLLLLERHLIGLYLPNLAIALPKEVGQVALALAVRPLLSKDIVFGVFQILVVFRFEEVLLALKILVFL